MTGKALPLPPKDLIEDGSPEEFLQVGSRFLDNLINMAGLTPESHVLDLGSGSGRLAFPLTNYLSNAARYEGLDIVKVGVSWCQENITPRFPNFQFTLVDINNSKYNRRGKLQAEAVDLPFRDDSFDVVFLVSVFTHMLPVAVEHYLQEIERVLRPGGRILSTFFLLNDEARSLVSAGKSGQLSFETQLGECYVQNADVPEGVVAYDEKTVFGMLHKAGLSTAEGSPHNGSWCGRADSPSFQDIWVANKALGRPSLGASFRGKRRRRM